VFIVVACLDALTAILAITVLKQMRRKHFEATAGEPDTVPRRLAS